jgi:hypothetical protein
LVSRAAERQKPSLLAGGFADSGKALTTGVIKEARLIDRAGPSPISLSTSPWLRAELDSAWFYTRTLGQGAL